MWVEEFRISENYGSGIIFNLNKIFKNQKLEGRGNSKKMKTFNERIHKKCKL